MTHGLSRYPDLVVVQLKMSDGYVSEAGGVTFNSESYAPQDICGTVFAYDDQEIRIWSSSDNYVFCARDGWGKPGAQSTDATLYIQAWVLCTNQFTRTFVMDKNNADTASPTVDRVPLKSVYSLDSMLVSVEMKALRGNNTGFTFYAGGSAMIDQSSDPYGAIIYAYTETEVLLWRPSIGVANGYLIYVGGIWGAGTNNQQDTVVEVTVKVIDFNGSPCSEKYNCIPNWTYLASNCASTDCPTPVDIPNANKLYDGVSNGSQNLYSCANGFTGSSNDSMTQCVNGTWTATAMYCKDTSIHPYSLKLNQTIEQWIEYIRKELKINRKTTSAYTRSLISVYDPRPSAVAIGGAGIGVLCLVGLILLLPDIINIFRYCCESKKQD